MHEDRFRHEVLYYAEGVDGFVAGTLPFVQRALAAEEPVLVAVGAPRIEGLKDALGDDAERVRFALAFDPGQAWHLLCPYDVDGLADEVIEAARLSHPLIAHDAGTSHDCETYACAHEPSRPLEDPLPPPQPPVQERMFGLRDLGSMRHFVSAWASEELLEQERRESLVLAVNELATNSIRHGGGGGSVLVWRESDTLLCEVRDSGRITDALVGRLRPALQEFGGRGLWLVNQLCDLVQVRSSPSGTVVRTHMRTD